MWHSRPLETPPLHGKYHLKFTFWLFDTVPYLGSMVSLCFSSDSSGKAILVLFFSFSQKIIANFIYRSTSYLASSLNLLPQRSTTREGIWNIWSTGDVVFLINLNHHVSKTRQPWGQRNGRRTDASLRDLWLHYWALPQF